jgi:hypothetical protein
MIKLLDLTNPRHRKMVAEEIARAKRIIREQSMKTDDVNMLAAYKILDWMKNNKQLVGNFVYTTPSGNQSYFQIMQILDRGNPSQLYLKGLIDDMDKLEGVAIDDGDFYDDDSKQIPGRTQDFPYFDSSK